ncbi:MAG: hypothetical protein OXG88_00005, partial [Gammaproteobacteria bacterium]|nr:hypothetical protein [Gammaproteobacteria bacterium]
IIHRCPTAPNSRRARPSSRVSSGCRTGILVVRDWAGRPGAENGPGEAAENRKSPPPVAPHIKRPARLENYLAPR